jgi:large subunit ribosomal protein L31
MLLFAGRRRRRCFHLFRSPENIVLLIEVLGVYLWLFCIENRGKQIEMKSGIHPKYITTSVICSCGNIFQTRSTAGPTLKVEICSACHPFFTGQQKFVDTAGRVEKFLEKMEKTRVRQAARKEKTAEPTEPTI